MFKKYFTVVALVLGISTVTQAQNEAGVVVGTASGFSGVLDLGQNRALDLGFAYGYGSELQVYADYLFRNARQFKAGQVPLSLYYGIGARVRNIRSGKHDGKAAIGPRTPIGLTYLINNPDITIFGELAPVLDIVPDSGVEVMVGLGFRIRF